MANLCNKRAFFCTSIVNVDIQALFLLCCTDVKRGEGKIVEQTKSMKHWNLNINNIPNV